MEKKNELREWRRMVAETIPAFEPLLFACNYVQDEKAGVGTFCVNAGTLEVRYSPSFAGRRSCDANAFVLAHEIGHVILRHGSRTKLIREREGKAFRPGLWTIATEISVNNVVRALSGWPIPSDSGALEFDDPKFLPMSSEEIYAELKKCCIEMKVPCCLRGEEDGENPSGATALLVDTTIDGFPKAVENRLGKRPGDLPGDLREVLAAHLKLQTRIDWRRLLARFLTAMEVNCKEFDLRTIYRRPQMLGSQLTAPNLTGTPTVRKLALSVDNSGSVSDELFAQLVGVLDSFAQRVGFQEMLVYHFTSEVIRKERYTSLKGLAKFKRVGCGGTDITECNEQARKDGVQFNLILTDGEVDWLAEYSVPTLVVLVTDVPEPPKVKGLLGCVWATE